LLADVRKRLSAIRQYSTLGSGFKIAMRDLEIRGAGNLLGAEQSGHITAVGFDLYCQLLKQSIASLKGEKVTPRLEAEVRLDFLALNPVQEHLESQVPSAKLRSSAAQAPPAAAYIPYRYISDARQRIEIYRKIAQATEKTALHALQKELRDRFGLLPRTIELLLIVAELKILAAERGITAIEVKEDKLMLTRNNDLIMVGTKFPRLVKKGTADRLKEIRKVLLAMEIKDE
jgi:transcription-repair coupling factor (superfamily II helicase)